MEQLRSEYNKQIEDKSEQIQALQEAIQTDQETIQSKSEEVTQYCIIYLILIFMFE